MEYNIVYEGYDDEEIEYRVLYFPQNNMYTMEIRDIQNKYFGMYNGVPDAIGVALFLLHPEDVELLSDQEEYMHHGALKLCKKIPRDRLLMSKFVNKNDVFIEYDGTITPKTESLESEEDEEENKTIEPNVEMDNVNIHEPVFIDTTPEIPVPVNNQPEEEPFEEPEVITAVEPQTPEIPVPVNNQIEEEPFEELEVITAVEPQTPEIPVAVEVDAPESEVEITELVQEEKEEYAETKKVYIITKAGEETEQSNSLKGFFDIETAEKFMMENQGENFILKELDFSEFIILTEKYKGFNLFIEETKPCEPEPIPEGVLVDESVFMPEKEVIAEYTAEQIESILNDVIKQGNAEVLEPVIKQIENDEIETESVIYLDYNELFELILYLHFYNPQKRVDKPKIRYSQIYKLYALDLVKKGDCEKAEYYFKKAMEWNCVDTSIVFEYTDLFLHKNDMEKLHSYTVEAFPKIYTRNALAKYLENMGRYKLQSGKKFVSLMCFKRALELDPDSESIKNEFEKLNSEMNVNNNMSRSECEEFLKQNGVEHNHYKFLYDLVLTHAKNAAMAKDYATARYLIDIECEINPEPEFRIHLTNQVFENVK